MGRTSIILNTWYGMVWVISEYLVVPVSTLGRHYGFPRFFWRMVFDDVQTGALGNHNLRLPHGTKNTRDILYFEKNSHSYPARFFQSFEDTWWTPGNHPMNLMNECPMSAFYSIIRWKNKENEIFQASWSKKISFPERKIIQYLFVCFSIKGEFPLRTIYSTWGR